MSQGFQRGLSSSVLSALPMNEAVIRAVLVVRFGGLFSGQRDRISGAAGARSGCHRRRGFSLLEIMLALAILGGAMAVLSQIAGTGTDAAREARSLATARVLCQTKLAEILIDPTVSPQSVPPTPIASFDSASTAEFSYMVEVQPAPIDGLLALRVTVKAVDPNEGPPLATYSLDRWIIDPALGLEQAEAEAAAVSGGTI